MYLIINDKKYNNVSRNATAQRVTYVSSELTEGIAADGIIWEYRNDGFLLREVSADRYARQISRSGVLTLTNEPEVKPVSDEGVTWEAMAAAIEEGVNEV